MTLEPLSAASAPPASGGYAQAVRVTGASELVFISGQIPVTVDGETPSAFVDQCRLVWSNVVAQLDAAGLDVAHLVKVTTFLADRRFADDNRTVRNEVLGRPHPGTHRRHRQHLRRGVAAGDRSRRRPVIDGSAAVEAA